MGDIRHMYPGGNTRYGFYSLYEYLIWPQVERKIILKGGPGTGKSTLMKNIGQFLAEKGLDIEYHWCSSDDNSLDGIVIGKHKIGIVDGTAPHVIDAVYPGAVDEILNLGQFWKRQQIRSSRDSIIKLTQAISSYFSLAYLRLRESGISYEELQSHHKMSLDQSAWNRNALALSADFLADEVATFKKPRHLFAAAITPSGVNTSIDRLLPGNSSIFAVKGNPGSGIKELFKFVENNLVINGIYAEIYHNPFDPLEIDLIILPQSRKILLDNSSHIVAYENKLANPKYRRILDFDTLLDRSVLGPYAKSIAACRDRMEVGIKEAVNFIVQAKKAHDELEAYYIPAMDFEAINTLGDKLQQELWLEVQDL
ncbi:MAG: hypothetical protein GX119_00940 [Syntrophomonadaceae bacterium]|nr:hypothetical protein [Syntrophomonadaceae bacterium]